MDFDLLEKLLLWCAIANYGVLLFFALVTLGARDWIYRMHSRWFQLTRPWLPTMSMRGSPEPLTM